MYLDIYTHLDSFVVKTNFTFSLDDEFGCRFRITPILLMCIYPLTRRPHKLTHSTLSFFHSRVFHPCYLVPRFPLPRFPLPRFPLPHFQCPHSAVVCLYISISKCFVSKSSCQNMLIFLTQCSPVWIV